MTSGLQNTQSTDYIRPVEHTEYRLHQACRTHRVQITSALQNTQSTDYTRPVEHTEYRLHQACRTHRVQITSGLQNTQSIDYIRPVEHTEYRLHQACSTHRVHFTVFYSSFINSHKDQFICRDLQLSCNHMLDMLHYHHSCVEPSTGKIRGKSFSETAPRLSYDLPVCLHLIDSLSLK